MGYYDSISSAITRYYVFNGIFREGEEGLGFFDVDSELYQVARNLETEFAGTARSFRLELDSFDEETHNVEIIVGFTLWPYEDDQSEVELILQSVREELEKIGFIEDDYYYLGDGPDIR
ncbi:MAG: hypothetical protein ACTSR2_09225 [Candidatus Hodarchaeales archaeon]